jgi:hypothetical protein
MRCYFKKKREVVERSIVISFIFSASQSLPVLYNRAQAEEAKRKAEAEAKKGETIPEKKEEKKKAAAPKKVTKEDIAAAIAKAEALKKAQKK